MRIKLTDEELKSRLDLRKKKYRLKNKERLYAASVRWREKNKEKVKGYQAKWSKNNIERKRATSREWVKKNKERCKDAYLKRNFGISLEDFSKMSEKQKGLCAICGRPERNEYRRSLAVDHCHKTGRVRGLLCADCNRGLGMFKDSSDILRKAQNYLDAFQGDDRSAENQGDEKPTENNSGRI